VDLALEALYRWLAAGLSDPRSARWQLARRQPVAEFARRAADLVRQSTAGSSIDLGCGELGPEAIALDAYETAVAAAPEAVVADYERVFGLSIGRDCPPYETEFHPNDEPFFRAQQMADVAGFYRAFGLVPSAESGGRPDYLPMELEFSAWLLLKQRSAGQLPDGEALAATCRDARRAFVRDHLTWWVPSFASALRRQAIHGSYAALADVLSAVVAYDRVRLALPRPASPLEARADDSDDSCQGCLAEIKA
jgi:TorA maturation chaperone TorD